MKIMHIITGLGTGGAETMLYKLACLSAREDIIVVSLQDEATMGKLFRDQGIPLETIQIHKKPLRGLLKLFKVLLQYKPSVIQGWMYHGNLFASLVKLATFRKKTPVVWNIRQCVYDLKKEKRATQYVIKLNAWLSHTTLVSKIVFNSTLSMEQHKTLGFNKQKFIYIPNGFIEDSNTVASINIREEVSLKPGTILVGHVGRYHPVKGHQYLIEAAGMVKKQYGDKVHFICIGHGVNKNPILEKLISENEVSDIFHFMGEQKQIDTLMRQFDIFVLPSLAEAFPNVLGEAMLAERVCIASNVGDVGSVLGEHGMLVPVANSQRLAESIINALEKPVEEKMQIGHLARERILAQFSIATIFEQYMSLYKSLDAI